MQFDLDEPKRDGVRGKSNSPNKKNIAVDLGWGGASSPISFEGSPEEWLAQELIVRQIKNPAFSLRAFAKKVKISPASLSKITTGKRVLTAKNAKKIAAYFSFSNFETQLWLEKMLTVNKFRAPSFKWAKSTEFQPIRDAEFKYLADWKPFAILSLMETRGENHNIEWISERLSLRPKRVKGIMNKLEHFGLVNRDQNGNYQLKVSATTTTHDIPSAHLKRQHKQKIQLAMSALNKMGVQERDITSMTFASTPEKMKMAKKWIQEFRRSLMFFMEAGEKTEVYSFNMQLFPLSRRKK